MSLCHYILIGWLLKTVYFSMLLKYSNISQAVADKIPVVNPKLWPPAFISWVYNDIYNLSFIGVLFPLKTLSFGP